MENFNLSDFTMDFEFDFQHDFTANENQVIDDILKHATEFDVVQENPSSCFEYFCENSGAVNGLARTTEQLLQSQQQVFPLENAVNETGFYQHNFPTASTFSNPYQIESTVDEENVVGTNFDWTTFLEDKPSIQSDTVNWQSVNQTIDQKNRTDQDNLFDSSNENGFIYQELNTLDIPKIYDNLGKAFGLDDLKKLDACLDYSSLSMVKHGQLDHDDHARRNGLFPKKKVFLMPMELNAESNESLQNVATTLKKHPFVLNSMLNQCDNTKRTEKIELSNGPKQIKQQCERYLSVREGLERIAIKEITIPMIQSSSERRRQRKQITKTDNEKVPIQYAVDIVVTDINRNGTFTSKETVIEKTKSKKQMPKPKATTTTDEPEEPKKNRRTNKKN